MDTPHNTIDFITYLKSVYPDKVEEDPSKVGTPAYWKKVGIIELIRKVEESAGLNTLKQIKA